MRLNQLWPGRAASTGSHSRGRSCTSTISATYNITPVHWGHFWEELRGKALPGWERNHCFKVILKVDTTETRPTAARYPAGRLDGGSSRCRFNHLFVSFQLFQGPADLWAAFNGIAGDL